MALKVLIVSSFMGNPPYNFFLSDYKTKWRKGVRKGWESESMYSIETTHPLFFFHVINFQRLELLHCACISRSMLDLVTNLQINLSEISFGRMLILPCSITHWSSNYKCPQWISKSCDRDFQYPTLQSSQLRSIKN